jgi:ADP-ribose pyrophosphatase YjhB (NUDIX family)
VRRDQISGVNVVRAAGGLVWRRSRRGLRLAVVHRPNRSDWSIPKGKLEAGEAWREAALREVKEETGCQARITAFAGAKLLIERSSPKMILYWHMRLVRHGEPANAQEVDEVAWLSPREALDRFDHASDQRLLLRSLAGGRWREHDRDGRERATPETSLSALRRFLVLDRERPEGEVLPYLRIVAQVLDEEERSRAPREHALALPPRAS